MKKLLIIMTLFVSSFFLFCNKEVKAEEIIKKYEDYSLVESDVFLLLKEKAEETLITNNYKYYIIVQYPSLIYHILFSNELNFKFNYYIDGFSPSSSRYTISTNPLLKEIYDSDGILTNSTDCTSTSCSSNYRFASLAYSSNNVYYLYSNFYLYFNYMTDFSLIIQFPDISYNFISSDDNTKIVPSLYSVYQEYLGAEQENPHQEEIDKVTNFYTMVIEKIEYLANEISNNYILLFIIGIFIVTFIFLLIFRRFIC